MTQNGDTVAAGDSFWDVSGYQHVVKRTECGVQMCGELSKLVLERSEIEKDYAKRLKCWAHKWRDNFDHGPEYGTNKVALMSMLVEAEELADVRLVVRDRLLAEVIAELKEWKAANYHKQMVGSCKEAKGFEDDFHKAQKPWTKKLMKVEKSKKDYHNACKAVKTAVTQENNAKNSSEMSADQVKKLTEKVERCRRDVESTRSIYTTSLTELNSYNAKYMEDMNEVFARTQDFEARRLAFFKKLLYDYHACVDATQMKQIPDIYAHFHQSVDRSDTGVDLKWWSDNYGASMPMAWPQFEEYTDEFHAISRKERGMRSAVVGGKSDGVTLKSIQRTDDAPSVGHAVASATSSLDTHDTTTVARQQSVDLNDEWDVYQNIAAGRQEPPQYEYSQPPPTDTFQPRPQNGSYSHSASMQPPQDSVQPSSFKQADTVVVRALYDYQAQEPDELSFKAGDVFVKVRDRDEQGWCAGLNNGRSGLYPDNYVEIISH